MSTRELHQNPIVAPASHPVNVARLLEVRHDLRDRSHAALQSKSQPAAMDHNPASPNMPEAPDLL